MKTQKLALLGFLAALLTCVYASPMLAQMAVYNPTTDFSITNGNPNGVWSYGWMPEGFGALNLFTNALTNGVRAPHWAGWNRDYTPGIWKNIGPQAYGVPTGWLSLHPGPGTEPSVLRWTAPAAGPVDLEGEFLPGDIGSMQVAIRLNNQPWWGAANSGSFSLFSNVMAGDTIDFLVYGAYHYGNTPLTVSITNGSPVVPVEAGGQP